MSNSHYFHFTLGPVQGFVSQARRTRDFWAGSFILSWLSSVAIKAVLTQEGEVSFPAPDENYMRWLAGEGKGKPPAQGSIPNRFKGLVAAVDPKTFKPEQVTAAVQEAWEALAKTVWEGDLKPVVGNDSKTRTIWDRQVSSFWDMSWVITEDKEDSAALDRRKNWRSYTPPSEPGVKCAMMDGWQELSGELKPNRSVMNTALWTGVLRKGKQGMLSDLREDEALCAMAFIKRRFSRHFESLDHKMKQGWQLKGWEVPSAVPSVTYMAAVHWLEQMLTTPHQKELDAFHQAAKTLVDGEYSAHKTRIACLDVLQGFEQLKALDGNVFFDSLLENKNTFKDQEQAKKVAIALNALCKQHDGLRPTPFYAVLMMDGDSLGKHMSNTDLHHSITQGLAEFTSGVPARVSEHNGFLIYAGGDDVLAVLPLEDAIPCAAALRTLYLNCFKPKPHADPKKDRKYIPTTLSGAIEFVPIKMPLTKVLQDAHSLLDDVAKAGSGRDSLAIRVWKPGGLQLEWSQPWSHALVSDDDGEDKTKDQCNNGECNRGKLVLEVMAEQFSQNLQKDASFTNKFFFKLQERFTLLSPAKSTGGDSDKGKPNAEQVLNNEEAISLMTMEYLNSWGSERHKNYQEARVLVAQLLDQCRPYKRHVDEGGRIRPTNQLKADGALLVRFLAQKGVK